VSMELRLAGPDDAERLSAFARDAFDAAFGSLYRQQDLASFYAGSRSAETYRRNLSDPAVRTALLEEDGAIRAYALLILGRGFPERPQPHPARPALLSQLYCAGGTTGQGLGASLLDWATAEARDWGADALQLSVYSENHGAQRFYRRHGFAHIADIHYWVGTHRDDEYLYELPLG